MAKQIKCPNCQEIIILDESSPTITCANCNKTYKNPSYQAKAPEAPVQTAALVAQSATPQMPPLAAPTSEFNGGLGSLIGLNIVNFLLLLFTLGLAYPWVICRSYRWEIEHKIIDGKKLAFDGTGGGLFGQWIKWMLLTLVTIGIYSLWIPIKKLKWITEKTHFVSQV